MSSMYVLYSESIDRFYIGSCLNLVERLKQHNDHTFDKSFTRRAKDWKIFFRMDNLTHSESLQIEQHLKKMKSRKYLNNLSLYPEMKDKLYQKYIGSSR